jgi:pheromone shutdown-related protein TraB
MQQSDTVSIVEYEGRTIYLVGTAHVSSESVHEVREVIEEVKPDTVCIELCPARYNALTNESAWKNLDVFKVIKEGKMLFLLANLAIGAHQRRLGAELGVRPGAELLAAAKAAEEQGAELVLADRDIHVTLKRTWGNLGFWTKMSLLGAVMKGAVSRDEMEAIEIEELKKHANLSEMLAEFAKELPEVKVPLIDERDQYLISKIREAEGDTIVAVVGAAHVPGMKENIDVPVDREELEQLPKKKWWVGLLKWVIPVMILSAFVWGYYRHDGGSFEDMLWAWILPNSIMAALLTAIAGGKIISVITAFFSSPITSLNPMIGTGMVVGLLEAWLRKPTVEDCEKINEDVQSLRGVYKNKVTRVLLVAVMSGLGSAIGAWIGLSWVVTLVP